jgi:hypothetical protein
VQEQHDLADHLLVGPAGHDPFAAHRPDARHFGQALGVLFDHIEHGLAECLDQLLGIDRADAADHARTEIFLDPLQRGRQRGAQESGAELHAVGAVIDPVPGRLQEFAGRDAGGMADDGNQVPVAARLDAQNAEPVLGIVERHPLDHAGKRLAVGSGTLGGHGGAPDHHSRSLRAETV